MLKKGLKIAVFLLVPLLLFVLYIFTSTGYFRPIENRFPGAITQHIGLAGVEDMQISYADDFLLLSSDDRASRRDGDTIQGHLYLMDLSQNVFVPQKLTTHLDFPFFPHGISMVQTAEDKYLVYAINHVGKKHTIEVFDLSQGQLVHRRTLADASMISPNDIVAIDAERFYFTNDHGYTSQLGRFIEDYLGWAVSNVVYFDGTTYREVADGIAYANGINADQNRKLLFVASPRSFLVKTYQITENGDLSFIEDIDCGTGVDNIELDPDGKLWIGCHPNLLRFAAYAKGKKATAPSEVITINYRTKGDYTVQSVFLDDGSAMSASTVAAPYHSYWFVGNVMDDHFLVLQPD